MTLKFANITIPIWIYDIDQYRIHWANEPALDLWESTSLDELRAIDFKPITPNAIRESLLQYQKAFKQGEKLFHNWHFSPKGIDKHAFCQLSPYILDDGRTAMLVEAIPVNKLNYDMQVGFTVLLSSYLADGCFISGNTPFLKAMGRKVLNLSDIVVDPQVLQAMYRSLSQSGRFESDVLIQSVSEERWCHVIAVKTESQNEVNTEQILLHQYDIHQRKTSEIALAQEVVSDALTGLLNRRGLDKKLSELECAEEQFAVYYIDLDGFKLINDSFGHGVGDQVLQSVASRLLTCLPSDSFACRFGGDEFVVGALLSHIDVNKEQLASDLVTVLSETYYDQCSQAMTLSASIGIAQYPADAALISDVIQCADSAMYKAKQAGKRRWVSYELGMEQSIQRQSLIAQHLSYAESQSELFLHYQPIWSFNDDGTACIVSFEALLRWHNIELGWVPPEELVQVAEEIGIIHNIEQWVARQALSDLMSLRRVAAPEAGMSINISAIHLLDATLPKFLLSLLKEKGLFPEDLTVELTESTLIADIDKDNSTVRQLVENGINISIDDFGTGYSSLAYLHHIPAKTVKIDRTFVQNVEENSKTIQHIFNLIETYDMKALIEGVETEQQKEKLLSVGIQLHQGYLLGKPKPLSFYIENQEQFNS